MHVQYLVSTMDYHLEDISVDLDVAMEEEVPASVVHVSCIASSSSVAEYIDTKNAYGARLSLTNMSLCWTVGYRRSKSIVRLLAGMTYLIIFGCDLLIDVWSTVLLNVPWHTLRVKVVPRQLFRNAVFAFKLVVRLVVLSIVKCDQSASWLSTIWFVRELTRYRCKDSKDLHKLMSGSQFDDNIRKIAHDRGFDEWAVAVLG